MNQSFSVFRKIDRYVYDVRHYMWCVLSAQNSMLNSQYWMLIEILPVPFGEEVNMLVWLCAFVSVCIQSMWEHEERWQCATKYFIQFHFGCYRSATCFINNINISYGSHLEHERPDSIRYVHRAHTDNCSSYLSAITICESRDSGFTFAQITTGEIFIQFWHLIVVQIVTQFQIHWNAVCE